MKLLSPSPSPRPPRNSDELFYGFGNSQTGFRRRTHRVASQPMEMVDEDSGKVYVAVGKSFRKASVLVEWSLRNFVDSEICILFVHQPSPYIPTLLGKLPASQANDEVVTAYRNEEWGETRKLLNKYLNICTISKVQASIVTAEADQVQKGIVDLVFKHNIKKLVIGAVPDCLKLKKSSAKASYAAKMAPPLCEIWFVNKGKLVWKTQPSEGSNYVESPSQEQYSIASNLLSRSLPSHKSNIVFTPKCKRSDSAPMAFMLGNHFQRVGVSVDVASSHTSSSTCGSSDARITSPAYFGSSKGYSSSAESCVSSDSITKHEEEILYEQLAELMKEGERSRDEASAELLLRSKLEIEVVESIKEVKAFVSAHANELELRKEAEDALKTTIQQQEKLVQEREETAQKLHQATKSIAVLDSCAQEANRHCNEVSTDLKSIQASIANLQKQNHKIQRQKFEATVWLDRWKNRSRTAREVSGIMQLNGETSCLSEFSLSDLQAATCDFSDSFKIGQGGYGAVYKGELMEKTVAIKRLHPHNIHIQPEFFEEAQVLCRLRHPHLVSLIGVCPEAWSLVYDYIPGGSLQDRLFCRSNNIPLDWKTRVRVLAEIASCLLFLHSLNFEDIVHGDLKPNNILLDSENSCKVCDFGISRLLPNQPLRCPSFGHSTETRAFPYADPEFFRTGIPTPKSDIFSFGLIILQMVTGKFPAGLISEVRKTVSCGKTSSIMDSSAGEWSMFVVRRLVDLGLRCCELNGKDRPEITPMLVRELEHLYVLENRQPVPSFFLCPILQEIMHDPQVAADGFTYEGEALQAWLENGRETSPMTNLKLSHLTLTPNHSLRLAIQEWICNL